MIAVADIPLTDLKRLHAELAIEIDKREQLAISRTIERIVEGEFGLRQNTLHAQTKALPVARPRQIAMTLMLEAGMTWDDTGPYFNLSPSAAYYNSRKITELESTDSDLAKLMQRLRIKVASALKSPSNF